VHRAPYPRTSHIARITGGAARKLRGDRTLWATPASSKDSSGSSSSSSSSAAPLDRLLLQALDRLVAHALGPRLGGASDLLWRSDAQMSIYPANGSRYDIALALTLALTLAPTPTLTLTFTLSRQPVRASRRQHMQRRQRAAV